MEGELGSWEAHEHRDALGPKQMAGAKGEPLGAHCMTPRKQAEADSALNQ